MLNLRNVDTQGVQVWSSHVKPGSEIRFATSMVGNLGAPLELGRLGDVDNGSRRASMVSLRREFAASGDAFAVGLVDEALFNRKVGTMNEQMDEEYEDDDRKEAY